VGAWFPALAALAHGRLTRELGIKANPPEYRRQVARLGELMAGGFEDDIAPSMETVIVDIAETADLPSRKRAPAAKRILGVYSDHLGTLGRDIPEGRRQAMGRTLGAAYRLGLDEVAKPLGWDVDFSLPDTDALAGIHDSGLFWVGEFYGSHFDSDTLRRSVNEIMIEQGLGRVAAGKELKRLFGEHVDKSDAYWRGLAATTATRARSFGALTSLVETGAVSYEYINPDDERTSEVCRTLNGQIFTVSGSVALRERFLGAKKPEDVKKIAPWPRVKDLKKADGSLKLSAELQAQGIAWPPLHFHCRSSIEVAEWGPMPDASDPIGDVDLSRKVKPTRKVKPKIVAKPGAELATTVTEVPWTTAQAHLDRATADAVAAGLNPDRYAVSKQFTDDLMQHVITTRDASPVFIFPHANIRHFQLGGEANSLRMRELVGQLRAPGNFRSVALADRAARELELLDAVTAAYRAGVPHAPVDWLAAQRLKWGDVLLDGQIPKGWRKADKLLVRNNWHKSLSMYEADTLRLLGVEGERLRYNPRNRRGFATPGRPGSITVDLKKLRKASPDPWEWQVWSHEWHHRFDGIMGGTGIAGRPWVARAGYENAPKVWQSTFNGPFQAAKSGTKVADLQKLRGEKANQSAWRWGGNWVDPYEARIYSGRKPTQALLDDPMARSGPIEFIAQAASYQAEHTQGWRDNVLSLAPEVFTQTGFGDTHFMSLGAVPGVSARLAGYAHQAGRNNMAKLRQGWALYGEGWRDGMEQLHGGGARFLRELADTLTLKWNGDGDVISTAYLFKERYGVTLKQSIGPNGILRKHMSADAPSLAKIRETMDRAAPEQRAMPTQQIDQWRAFIATANDEFSP